MTIKFVDKHPSRGRQGVEPMGKNRVAVTLSNAIDEGIARRGDMAGDAARTSQASALVDTGAVRCCLPINFVKQLGVATIDRTVAEFADGRQEVVEVTEPIHFQIAGRSTFQPALIVGDEVLIGQLALEDTDLWADSRDQRLVPNPAHPDQPVFAVK